MEEEYPEFTLEVEKIFGSDITYALWAPTMDLLALATSDKFVELYRISFKAYRVFGLEQSNHVRTMAFSANSQLLAYCLDDGDITIVLTENGQKIVNYAQEMLRDTLPHHLSFLSFTHLEVKKFMPFQRQSPEEKLIQQIAPHKNCNKAAIVKINYFTNLRNDFSILLASHEQSVKLLINGFIPIAELRHKPQTNTKLPHQADIAASENLQVVGSHLHENKLWVVLSGRHLGKVSNNLYSVCYDSSSIWRRKDELITKNCLLTYVHEIMDFLQTAYGTAEQQTKEIVRTYMSKMKLIDDENDFNIVPWSELNKFLFKGVFSPPIQKFFKKELYDSKILQKLDETLIALFGQLHDLLLESVQNALEKAAIILNRVVALYQAEEDSQETLNDLKMARTLVEKLYTIGEALLLESTECKLDLRNLMVWFNKSCINYSPERQQETQNVKSPLNRFNVDFKRLYAHVGDRGTFELGKITRFFQKQQEISLIPPKPQFRMFTGRNSSFISGSDSQYRSACRDFQVQDILSDEEDSGKPSFTSVEPIKSLIHTLNDLLKKLLVSSTESVKELPRQVNCLCSLPGTAVPFVRCIASGNEFRSFSIINSTTIVVHNLTENTCLRIVSNLYNIRSLSVSSKDVLCVLQQKEGQDLIVAKIKAEAEKGAPPSDTSVEIPLQIQAGVSKLHENQCWVGCGAKGLHCLILGKKKMVIVVDEGQ